MRSVILTFPLIALILLVGCSEKSDTEFDDKPYDLASNPDQFPQRAIDLLQKIRDGKLVMYDLIVDNFADLYMVHPDLLEDPAWHRVIRRIGRDFETRANQLSQRGVQFYAQAAGYYRLASFADPENDALAEKSRLFETWTDGISDMASLGRTVRDFEDLDEACRVVRFFLFGSELQQQFAREYLITEYLEPTIKKGAIGVSHLASLKPVNQAFLAWSGIYPGFEMESKGEFKRKNLSLLAAIAYPLDSTESRLEFFVSTADSTDVIAEYSGLVNIATESDQPDRLPLESRTGEVSTPYLIAVWGQMPALDGPLSVGLVAQPDAEADTLWMGL